MSLLGRFRRQSSAPVARERLQILLSHERAGSAPSDLLSRLRDEIVAVVARHVPVERDQVAISMDRGVAVSRIEINVEIPHRAGARSLAGAGPTVAGDLQASA